MSKFNTKKTADRVSNLAGGIAFKMDAKTELVHGVLTTFLEDKFYESGEDRVARLQELVKKVPAQFVANLAYVARIEFNLRSVSHLLLGELAKTHKGDDLVKRTIVACAIRPDDLTELASYVGKPLTKQVKRGIRNALFKFNRYELAKYKGEGKEMTMVDLFNMVHPKAQFANEEQKVAWKDLMEGNLVSTDTWESEVSKDATKETWEKLLLENKMGYMALLRNLNNFIKYKVSDEALNNAIAILTDPERVKKSKQLPFRFYTAYMNVTGNRKFSNAISEAMDLAVSNTPKLPGRTLIAIDSSGSMRSCMDKASIFGATLLKANDESDVILYDTSVKEFGSSSRVPVVDIADRIAKEAMGGGTQTSLVFAYASEKAAREGIKYDRIIIISDNESWAEGYSGNSVQDYYNGYKNKFNVDPFVYAIDIEGYGSKDITSPKVKHLAGWSERLLDFIGEYEKGNDLIKYIEGKTF